MTIALIIAIVNAFAALVAHVANHPVWCGINIAMAAVFIFLAMAYEGRTINRIKKLEEEIETLKKENYHGKP